VIRCRYVLVIGNMKKNSIILLVVVILAVIVLTIQNNNFEAEGYFKQMKGVYFCENESKCFEARYEDYNYLTSLVKNKVQD